MFSVIDFRTTYLAESPDKVTAFANGNIDYEWSGSVVRKLSSDSAIVVGSPIWNDFGVTPTRYR